MLLMASRSLFYLTLFMYLFVGTISVRFFAQNSSSISIDTSYLNIFSKTQFQSDELAPVEMKELVFSEVIIPEEKVVTKKKEIKKIVKKEILKTPSILLPFQEPVMLMPINFNGDLLMNMIAMYKDLEEESMKFIAEFEKTAPVIEKEVTDELVVGDAKSVAVENESEEPGFFEYPQETAKPEQITQTVPEIKQVEQAPAPVVTQVNVSEMIEPKKEEVAEDDKANDIVVFDYSKAQEEIKSNKLPTVAVAVAPAKLPGTKLPQVVPQNVEGSQNNGEKQDNFVEESVDKLMAPSNTSKMSIQAVGTNLKGSSPISGFEVRFSDDYSAQAEDFNTGEVVIEEKLAENRMTRSVTLLKRGFAPTNTDLILEDGNSSASIPMIEEEVFNEDIAPYESRGEVGTLLVELDDKTESVEIDVPFGRTFYLDGDLKKTSSGDYRYIVFVGVKAGNALLAFKDAKKSKVTKIVHIHEREVVFEANYTEEVKQDSFKLLEEDLLAREKAPLIISADQVRQFATNKTAKKINDRTYKVNFGSVALGGRNYLELNHLSEPVFAGFRENTKLELPGENFMRFVLSRFENSKLGNRCLVQINLSKKLERFETGAESVGENLSLKSQVLDRDGRFYDSASDKTRKIMIVGENQGNPDIDQNARINIKLIYLDGTSQYLSTYCSPNSYLVEQL